MIILFVFVIAIIVVLFYLIFKTGGFLLDGFTSLVNRIFISDFSEFSSSEIMTIIILIIAFIISLETLRRIMRRY